MKRIAAIVVNDYGDMLPYTCDSTMEYCEERARSFLGNDVWERMKELGAKVVQVEIRTLDED